MCVFTVVKGLYVSRSLQEVWIAQGKFVQVDGQLDAIQCNQLQPNHSSASILPILTP